MLYTSNLESEINVNTLKKIRSVLEESELCYKY